MPAHRRREPAAAGDQFSFASPAHEDRGDADSDAYDTWAEKIKGKYNYFGRLEDVKYAGAGAWARRRTTRCGYDGEASGTPSPPELRQAAARRHDSGAPPPTIAMYRQEMLDLVKDAHENAYELSLIDMVEMTKTKTKKVVPAKTEEEEEKKKKGKKGTRRTSRSESMETAGGHLLKMFVPRVPAALGGRKKQGFSNSGTCAKVSPSKEYGDVVSTTTSNSNGSSTSTSTSSSSFIKSRMIGSCYPFVSHKGKPAGGA